MTTKSKTSTALFLLTILIAVGVFLIFSINNRNAEDFDTISSQNEQINQGADVPDNSSSKENVIKNNESPQSIDNSNGSILPVIVYSGVVSSNLEIGAYVPIVESGGTCEAIITHADSRVAQSYKNTTNPDAATTNCESFIIPTQELTQGVNVVRIVYKSERHSGSSEAVEVVIP